MKIGLIVVFLFFVIVTPLFSANAQEASGILWLSINNVDADFIVSGPQTFTKANAIPFDAGIKIGFGPQFGWKIEHMPAGTYTIIPANVNGYYVRTHDVESPNKTFTIEPGYSYFNWNTNIEYAPTKIEVRAYGLPNDISASFTITGPATHRGNVGSTGSWTMEKLPQGTYTLVWDEVPGYEKPESVTVTFDYAASNREEFLTMKMSGGISGYFNKKQQTAPAPSPSPVSSPVQTAAPLPPTPPPRAPAPALKVPAPKKESIYAPQKPAETITPSPTPASEQKSIGEAAAEPPQKPAVGARPRQNFVSRFFKSIFSFFKKLF